MINKYKTSKNSLILNVIPNKIYCFFGYWVEKVIPGIFESVIYDKSQKTFNEFRELKKKVHGLINSLNSNYQNIRKEFKIIF